MSIFDKGTIERVSTSEAKGLLWYPHAVIEPEGTKMKTNGSYRKGYPEGCVVHWTSGWNEGTGKSAREYAINSAKYGAKMGYSYFLIDREGTVYQCAPLDKWGSHAGTSQYKGLGEHVSKFLVGIEVMADGTMKPKGDKWVSWFGHEVPSSSVRSSGARDNIAAGVYHKYTEAQEEALTKLIVWLHKNNPSVFKLDYVIGHDECAPKRKVDPGAALSMTMPEFRKKLKSLV